jgi:hypothetical protein
MLSARPHSVRVSKPRFHQLFKWASERGERGGREEGDVFYATINNIFAKHLCSLLQIAGSHTQCESPSSETARPPPVFRMGLELSGKTRSSVVCILCLCIFPPCSCGTLSSSPEVSKNEYDPRGERGRNEGERRVRHAREEEIGKRPWLFCYFLQGLGTQLETLWLNRLCVVYVPCVAQNGPKR